MSGTKTTRAREAVLARLLEQAAHALGYRFEVPSAPSITIHVDPDGRGHWAVTRYGWVEAAALTESDWVPFGRVTEAERFSWAVDEALARIPALLAELDAEHATWQQQREQAERAKRLAEVTDELLEPVRQAVSTLKAGAA